MNRLGNFGIDVIGAITGAAAGSGVSVPGVSNPQAVLQENLTQCESKLQAANTQRLIFGGLGLVAGFVICHFMGN